MIHEGVTTLIPRRRYSAAFLINNHLCVLGIFPDQYKADKAYRMAIAMEDDYQNDTQFRSITGANRLSLYHQVSSMAYDYTDGGYMAKFLVNRYETIDIGLYPSRIEAGLAYDVARYYKKEYYNDPSTFHRFVRLKVSELIKRAGYALH